MFRCKLLRKSCKTGSKPPFALCSWTLLLSTVVVLRAAPGNPASSTDPSVKKADELFAARDYAGAFLLYKKAAEGGNLHAMAQLGLSYDQACGVKEDETQAMYWMRKAAEGGDTDGMAYLGGLYSAGSGVPVDYKQALLWFHKSADAGGASGMNKLGLAYQYGRGVEKNFPLAMQWFRKAADLGDMYALNNVGNMYLGNMGIPQDLQEALRWYLKAAALGEADSMNMIAVIYENGSKGIPRNPKEAEAWYRKSAALGNENGKQSLMRLGGWQNFDMNGDWEAYFTTPAIPEAIQITQRDNTLNAVRLRNDLSPMGIAFFARPTIPRRGKVMPIWPA
ncbi:MAG TPA: tetratricopeptide repeat protein [Bryobacteraceae bacterium]|nr:tetratricopeptide repeat protein [Bryobacteraceae bacterium]